MKPLPRGNSLNPQRDAGILCLKLLRPDATSCYKPVYQGTTFFQPPPPGKAADVEKSPTHRSVSILKTR